MQNKNSGEENGDGVAVIPVQPNNTIDTTPRTEPPRNSGTEQMRKIAKSLDSSSFTTRKPRPSSAVTAAATPMMHPYFEQEALSITATRNNKNNKMRNELTHLIPGYTAPLSLTSGSSILATTNNSSSTTSTLASLAQLTRRAMQKVTTVTTNRHPSSTNATTAAVSFKTGRVSKACKKVSKYTTAGEKWFHMTPSVMTDEIRYDLAVIRNRNALDPKRFYKSSDLSSKNNKNTILQVGTVVEGSTEFYSSRMANANRRSNLTDEILADPHGLPRYAQSKFKSMQQQKTAAAAQQKKRKKPTKASNQKPGRR